MDAGNTTNTPRRRFATRGRIWSLVALIAGGYAAFHASGRAAPIQPPHNSAAGPARSLARPASRAR